MLAVVAVVLGREVAALAALAAAVTGTTPQVLEQPIQAAVVVAVMAAEALALSSLEPHPPRLPQQDRLLSQLTLVSTSTNSRDQGALRSNGTLCRT
jgi:hypothetical protein